MIRNLTIISGAGLVLAAAGIGGSFMLGGADLARHSWTWAIDDDDTGGINIRRTIGDEAPRFDATRQIAWTPQDRLVISVPADVLYIQTDENPGITITGSQAHIDRLTFEGGHLLLGDQDHSEQAYVTIGQGGVRGWSDADNVKITIRAPSVKAFELSGSTDLTVRGYNQPSLDLLLTGSSDIEVQGRTDQVTVDASGNTSAELDELIGSDATIRASGSAGVKTAANGVVKVDGSGDARVRLTRPAAQLMQKLSGDASVRQD